MTPADLIRNVVFKNETLKNLFEKTYIVLSNRPFNLKGQEIEEQVAFYIENHLKELGYQKSYVKAPQLKKLPDIIYSMDGILEMGFELKNYGGNSRCQLSTLNTILPDLRNYFKNHKDSYLSEVDKSWLINSILKVKKEYTLSSFVIKNNNDYHLILFDIETIDISLFKEKQFYLKRVGKENRVEIFIEMGEGLSIEISCGGNPLNRGIWIRGIKSISNFETFSNLGYLNILSKSKFCFVFDKVAYNAKKAEITQKLIESIL
jgi:hypothetical protein